MNVAVFGTGMVGQSVAARLAELGHSVRMGTRDPQKTLARGAGDDAFRGWMDANPAVKLATYAEAAAFGEMVINATNGAGSLDALRAAGEDRLGGKILIDISNPLDFSRGMPPTLFISNDDSLGEQIQRAFPAARVVKTLNTVTARLMAYPNLIDDGRHTVFLSGNDAAAKAEVAGLLRSFGWQDILDLGDITTARGVEMYLPLWLRMWGALGTGMVNVRVVR